MTPFEKELPLVIARDPAAVGRFVREFGAMFRGLARRLCGGHQSRHEEDLVQEVFSSLFQDRARALREWKPDGGMSLKNFLYVFARQRMIDYLRRQKHIQLTDGDDPEPREADSESRFSLDDLVFAEKFIDHVRDSISADDWRLFELILAGRSVEENAAELGVRSGVLYQRIHRLRKRLREIYLELDGDRLPPAKEK